MFRKSLLASVFILTFSTLSAQIIDLPVATVRLHTTTVITQRQIQTKISVLEEELQLTLTDEQKMSLLDSEIDTELIMQAALNAGITASAQEVNTVIAQQRESLGIGAEVSDAQFRTFVQEQADMSWDEYLDRIERRIIQEKYIAQDNAALLQTRYTPTDNEINRVYEENISEFLSPAYARFDHIFIETRGMTAAQKSEAQARMTAFRTQIQNGGVTAFNTIVQESIDDPTYTGGDFGFLPRGEQTTLQLLGRTFIDGVFALNEGAVSNVLESNIGYHIVRITQKRSPRLLTLTDPVTPGGSLTVRQQIVQYIQAQKQQELLAQAVSETSQRLRAQAEVRLFDQNIVW